MKKLIITLFVSAFCLTALPTYAQKKLIKGVLTAPSKASTHAARKQLTESATLTRQGQVVVSAVTKNRTFGKALTTLKDGATSAQNLINTVQRQAAQPNIQPQTVPLLGKDLTFQANFRKSVFLAPVTAQGASRGFTVTAIKTVYQGKQEIFGVIATHVLPRNQFWLDKSIKRAFNMYLKQEDGNTLIIPAEVVQISPGSMLDISLVKFDSKFEPLLKPLELANETTALSEQLLSPGFASMDPMIGKRTVMQNSFVSVRTSLVDFGNRAETGFCGSPLLDMYGRVKAIHTGSVENKNLSYGTHAKFIKKLIEAYHNNGKASYDLMLDNHVLTTLNIDEYISGYAVLDSNFNILFEYKGKDLKAEDFREKYSEEKIRNVIHKYVTDGKYLMLYSRTAFWDTDAEGNLYLVEDKKSATVEKSHPRKHLYDIENHQWISTFEMDYLDI